MNPVPVQTTAIAKKDNMRRATDRFGGAAAATVSEGTFSQYRPDNGRSVVFT